MLRNELNVVEIGNASELTLGTGTIGGESTGAFKYTCFGF